MNERIECRGEVIGLVHGSALIRLERAPSSCGGCSSRSTCSSGHAASQEVLMEMPQGTKIGDQVTVSMPSSSVALAALLGYLLPPVFLLLGAIAADSCFGGDAAAVLGAAGGLLLGLLVARIAAHFTFGQGFSSAACDSVPVLDLPQASPYGEQQ
jgi:sigma-E factor negative regulatory protein RseC